MMHAQCNSLRHQENSPLAPDQTHPAMVHTVCLLRKCACASFPRIEQLPVWCLGNSDVCIFSYGNKTKHYTCQVPPMTEHLLIQGSWMNNDQTAMTLSLDGSHSLNRMSHSHTHFPHQIESRECWVPTNETNKCQSTCKQRLAGGPHSQTVFTNKCRLAGGKSS